jgi:hypothetical protein
LENNIKNKRINKSRCSIILLRWHKFVILIGIRKSVYNAFLLSAAVAVEKNWFIMSSGPYYKHEDTIVQREKSSASDSTASSDDLSEDDSAVGTALDGYSTTTVHTFKLHGNIHHSPDHGIVGEQQFAVSPPKNSKKRTMNEYKLDREKKMALLVQKKAELDLASKSMGRLPLSSNFASERKDQKKYTCNTCNEEIQVDCKCIRRSMRLYSEEINEGVQIIIKELHEARSHFKKTEDIKETRKKLKKMLRSNKTCDMHENKEGRLCYNCKLPSKQGCKCLRISARIPFYVWANDNMTESDLKQQLAQLFENKLRKKNRKIVNTEST